MEKMNFLLLFFLKLPLLIKGVEHCCKKKEVGGITYTLKRVAEGDLHLQYNCLNNCVYQQENSDKDICFTSGQSSPKCLEASDHFNSFKSEAIAATDKKKKFVDNKIEEYGDLKQFKTAKEKIEWIKKDIEDFSGQSWDEITSEQQLSRLPKSTREKIKRIEEKVMEHVDEILNHFNLAEHHDDVLEQLNKMEEDILHMSHSDHDVHRAAHYAIQAGKYTIIIFTEDKDGKTTLDRIVEAIAKNTEDTTDGWEITRRALRTNTTLGKTCLSAIGTRTVAGAAGGCAVGFLAGTPTVLGAPVGCASGAILGGIGGFAAGVGSCILAAFKNVCLGTKSTVETSMGSKKVFELEIGDYVKTSSGGDDIYFTEFLGWMDRQESQPSHMLNIRTSNGISPLTLSASHVVFTTSATKYAGDIQPGDCLLGWNGTAMEEMDVEAITPTISFGYWAPLTRAGHLLVDGYLTSCYASYPHQLADFAMAPVKAMPMTLLDDHKSQHNDGVRKVISFIKDIGKFIGARRATTPQEIFALKDASLVSFLPVKSEF